MTEEVSAHGTRSWRAELRRAWARLVELLGNAVRWWGSIAAGLLALHVVFTLVGANPENGIAQFVSSSAESLALGFQDLFVPADPELAVLLNYGCAALFWLITTSTAARAIHSLR